MASSPITSWEIDGEIVETVSDFMLGGSKITADGDGSHEIKRRLLLGRKVMTNLDGIFKSRDITLPTKVHLVKAMVFPVVMYGCQSWTVKKAEHRRIDAFELWCWRRLLRVPWTARRSNQFILKEISPGISLEGMMLKLKKSYLNGLVVFPYFLQFKSEFGKMSSWSEPQSAPSLVFADCIVLLHLAAKRIINLILVLTIWWCPCVESSIVLLEEGVCYDQCILLAELYYMPIHL